MRFNKEPKKGQYPAKYDSTAYESEVPFFFRWMQLSIHLGISYRFRAAFDLLIVSDAFRNRTCQLNIPKVRFRAEKFIEKWV